MEGQRLRQRRHEATANGVRMLGLFRRCRSSTGKNRNTSCARICGASLVDSVAYAYVTIGGPRWWVGMLRRFLTMWRRNR
jgi:hypothetical protein